MKHTRDTKRLGSLRSHLFAFQDAIVSAQLALQYNQSSQTLERQMAQSLSLHAVTAYARPFTDNEGMARPVVKPNSELVKLRHQISAHTNAVKHPYVTRVTISGGKAVNKSFLPSLFSKMNKVISESTKAQNQTVAAIHAVQKRIEGLNLPDGEYE